MSKAEKEKANKAKRKAERKSSKPAGGKARKPKRAPTIKKRKSKKKSFDMNPIGKLRKLSAFLYDSNLKNEVVGVSRLLQKLAKSDCPPATQDIEINTKNRNSTRDNHNYGPLNPDKPSEDYWGDLAEKWDATMDEAMSSRCANCVAFDISPRMKDCMPGETSDKDGVLGYCWMHHFKCHSARTCYTWAAGGPITKDSVSAEWQSKSA